MQILFELINILKYYEQHEGNSLLAWHKTCLIHSTVFICMVININRIQSTKPSDHRER